jgi:hypothetical protein
MENKFNSAFYKTIYYNLNCENGYYQKEPQLVPFNKLPNDLKVEETQKEIIRRQGANELIHGRIKNGKYTFLTGLIPIKENSPVYFGNNFEIVEGRKRTSLIVFVFSNENKKLTVYYFNCYYKDNRNERIAFVTEFIQSLS